MLTVAPPDALETRSNATFEALLWAMSRPGDIRTLPEPGMNGVIETLIDLECSAYAESDALRARLVVSGALLADTVADAAYVFVESLDAFETRLFGLNCGSAFYPDDGATVIVPASHGRGPRLRLTGPGIETATEIDLDIPAGFWAWRAQLSAYPEGFDLILVDGASVIAIPRSTQVEVL